MVELSGQYIKELLLPGVLIHCAALKKKMNWSRCGLRYNYYYIYWCFLYIMSLVLFRNILFKLLNWQNCLHLSLLFLKNHFRIAVFKAIKDTHAANVKTSLVWLKNAITHWALVKMQSILCFVKLQA